MLRHGDVSHCNQHLSLKYGVIALLFSPLVGMDQSTTFVILNKDV